MAAFTAVPLWIALPVLLLAVAALGMLAAMGQYVEGWFGYRLEREDGGILRVRRGLWIHRSVSIEERRLRGIELAEPLLLRCGGGARLQSAIATGLGNAEEIRTGHRCCRPPRARSRCGWRAISCRIINPCCLTVELTPHPAGARRRRINRALIVVAATTAAVALPGIWVEQFLPLAAATAAVLLPHALLLARDAYRALGHALVDDYLVVRSGTFARRTVALERGAVIGWTVSRSPFQRRLGLATLTAATAAGRGAYRVRDLALADALAFAEQAVPGLLDPFLERG